MNITIIRTNNVLILSYKYCPYKGIQENCGMETIEKNCKALNSNCFDICSFPLLFCVSSVFSNFCTSLELPCLLFECFVIQKTK